MKFVKYILPVVILTSCSPEIINMDTAKQQVKNYYESGAYSKEVEQIVDDTIDKLSDTNLSGKSAVVFDVDDTVLSGYEYTKSLGFGFTYPTWKEWMMNEKLKAIPEVKRLYDWLIEKHIHVIFLTGRRDGECSATYDNLVKEGYVAFDTLICRSQYESNVKAADYKPAQRKALTENGYNIVACIGDQWSDISGEFTGIKVKLPNYLYLVH